MYRRPDVECQLTALESHRLALRAELQKLELSHGLCWPDHRLSRMMISASYIAMTLATIQLGSLGLGVVALLLTWASFPSSSLWSLIVEEPAVEEAAPDATRLAALRDSVQRLQGELDRRRRRASVGSTRVIVQRAAVRLIGLLLVTVGFVAPMMWLACFGAAYLLILLPRVAAHEAVVAEEAPTPPPEDLCFHCQVRLQSETRRDIVNECASWVRASVDGHPHLSLPHDWDVPVGAWIAFQIESRSAHVRLKGRGVVTARSAIEPHVIVLGGLVIADEHLELFEELQRKTALM